MWDLRTATLLKARNDPALKDASRLLFSAAGDEILTLGDATSTAPRSWSFPDLQLHRLFGRDSRIPRLMGVSFTLSGRLLVFGGTSAVLWDFGRSRPITTIVPVRIDGPGPLARVADAHGQIISETTGESSSGLVHPSLPLSVAVSRNGQRMAAAYAGGEFRLWDLNRKAALAQFRASQGRLLRFDDRNAPVALSDDGRTIAVERDNIVEIYGDDGVLRVTVADEPGKDVAARPLAFSPSGQRLIVGYEDGRLRVVETRTGKLVGGLDLSIGPGVVGWDGDAVDQALFLNEDLAIARSMDGRFGDWRVDGKSLIKVDHAVFETMADKSSNEGLATFGVKDPASYGHRRLTGRSDRGDRWCRWDSPPLGRCDRSAFGGLTGDLGGCRSRIFTGRQIDCGCRGRRRYARMAPRSSAAEVAATLIGFTDGQWAVFSPNGQFDTNQIEQLDSLHWVMPDSPFRAFPPEVFMRDYFQPSLLEQTVSINASARSVADVTSINRVQPTVEVLPVERGLTPEEALVKVRVSVGDDATQPNGKTHTDVYDVRLFRDGELVGHSADEGSDEIGAWRVRTHVDMKAAGEIVIPFRVELPTQNPGKSVTFTAYAFNEDRVKSETAPQAIRFRRT